MKDKRSARRVGLLLVAAAVCAMACPASAQLGGLGRGLGGTLGPLIQAPERPALGLVDALDPQTLLSQRLNRLDALVSAHPREIERDEHGAPVVRGEVLAVVPSAMALARARQAGFGVKMEVDPTEIGLVVLEAPPGVGARDAVKRLRRLDPSGAYDYNHLYLPSGETSALARGTGSRSGAAVSPNARIGLIDTGVDSGSPVFAHAGMEQKAFASADVRPESHGTAVASLIVGRAAPFIGAAPGAALFVADVYGGAPTGGAADALVRALAWIGARRVAVVNISLVGPPNVALAAAIQAARAQGVVIVAAVGNDGPAAPASYPASYPGVLAITGVDARGRVLIEAGRSEHLDFAAPGADMAAAAKGGGFVAVRGTSFAAPLVAGRLVRLMAEDGLSAAAAEDALAREGKHGPPYGRGLIGTQLRVPPATVHAVRMASD